MKKLLQWLIWVGFASCLFMAQTAQAQTRPYIGYTYPAGGQQGTTFQIKLGGQGMDGVNDVLFSGTGITGKVVEYYRRMNNQEIQLLAEQLKELKRSTTAVASAMAPMMAPMMASEMPMMMMTTATTNKPSAPPAKSEEVQTMITKIEKRNREYVQTPACASISSLVFIEVTIAPDADPGAREIRIATARGISNPLVFHVGQVPEYSRTPMITANLQVLGKEAAALRKRPAAEAEDRVAIPCTVNGQIASGEVNRYRFEARKGQRLILSTLGRQLIPYIADAVPGWFQPVLTLYDAKGKEMAFDDDYRFMPDPVIFYEVPKDGEYVFAINDSLYRGREDFVYRITIGELPFVTSIFPLGRQTGTAVIPKMKGWNLQEAALTPPDKDAGPGVQTLTANRKGLVSNRVPFAVDTLPEILEKENNNTTATAQKITLPIIINGRMDKPDDCDVFQFIGKSNDVVVAEVTARRLDSPLDSIIQLTDAAGKLLALNDDHEDLGSGANTHQADSYLKVKLPADGVYYIQISDTARKGGEDYAYRLRISAPQPDFALRVVPSSISLKGKSSATLSVYGIRKDGFNGPIKLVLKDPPTGFTSAPVTLLASQTIAKVTFKCDLASTKEPVSLSIVGTAKMGDKEISHEAAPAEDRMQAFLWRHLVTANDLKVLVFDPANDPPPARIPPARPPSAISTNILAAANTTNGTNAVIAKLKTPAVAATNAVVASKTNVTSASATNVLSAGKTNGVTNALASTAATAPKPKFTKQQIVGRLKQLKLLYEEGLLTDAFYDDKVTECEVGQ